MKFFKYFKNSDVLMEILQVIYWKFTTIGNKIVKNVRCIFKSYEHTNVVAIYINSEFASRSLWQQISNVKPYLFSNLFLCKYSHVCLIQLVHIKRYANSVVTNDIFMDRSQINEIMFFDMIIVNTFIILISNAGFKRCLFTFLRV